MCSGTKNIFLLETSKINEAYHLKISSQKHTLIQSFHILLYDHLLLIFGEKKIFLSPNNFHLFLRNRELFHGLYKMILKM